MANRPKHHVTQSPLPVYSCQSDSPGVLPAGTSMQVVESFPEGFVRYAVYVNVERAQLPVEEVPQDHYVDPLAAYPAMQEENRDEPERKPALSREELYRLLAALGVSKDDLQYCMKRM